MRKPHQTMRSSHTSAANKTLGQVTLAEILLAGLEHDDPGPNADEPRRNSWNNTQSLTRRVMEFWGEMTSADLNEVTATEYRRFRSTQPYGAARRRKATSKIKDDLDGTVTPKSDKRVSYSTVTGELVFLRAQIGKYCVANKFPIPKIELGPEKPTKRRRAKPLTKGELVRLLWAARGAIYAPESDEKGTPDKGLKSRCFVSVSYERRPGQRRRWRRHMARLLLIAYYTGSPVACVKRLEWKGSPGGNVSYVDVEEGFLYRLGPDAAPGKLKGMPVPIPPRLLRHLRHWRDTDNQMGETVLIRSPLRRANPKRRDTTTAFAAIRKDAGLPSTVTERMIPDTTAITLMKSGVTLRSAAILMGMDWDVFEKSFAHYHKGFQYAATKALEKRPWTIRTMPESSRQWRDGS